ncbi:Uncharacterised protein [Vibrio cholerae]|uniref:Uncharacterized protein n=1 Tax=Vibrio cholerae TaxID=666 RepID=A0A655XXX9_VIBCL|nr:Uncharacterised protein [Vibrio cholerae]CSA86056.1 Uncharacterised protein [Vibrio cholerae]CSB35483.1 Uncharacterised protein [Vibrio cholerae]CSC25682.1 Uncharacterised protein [Vibrio cholerae]CSC26105.1 Uncharacterised protein [Vibrio cholerae]
MHYPLRNTFSGKTLQFLDQMNILQQYTAMLTCRDGVLVIANWRTVVSRKSLCLYGYRHKTH